jgi:hypothetical protein
VFIRDTLREANTTAAELGLEVVNEDEIKAAQDKGRGTQKLDPRAVQRFINL